MSVSIIANCSECVYASGRSSTALTTLKMAVLAPTPSAIVRTAVMVNAGFLRSVRAAKDRSLANIGRRVWGRWNGGRVERQNGGTPMRLAFHRSHDSSRSPTTDYESAGLSHRSSVGRRVRFRTVKSFHRSTVRRSAGECVAAPCRLRAIYGVDSRCGEVDSRKQAGRKVGLRHFGGNVG